MKPSDYYDYLCKFLRFLVVSALTPASLALDVIRVSASWIGERNRVVCWDAIRRAKMDSSLKQIVWFNTKRMPIQVFWWRPAHFVVLAVSVFVCFQFFFLAFFFLVVVHKEMWRGGQPQWFQLNWVSLETTHETHKPSWCVWTGRLGARLKEYMNL